MTASHEHAVVFSGNGYNAAYEVGVLKALLHGAAGSTKAPVYPGIYTGTSVGAYNAAFMVSRSVPSEAAAAEKLEQTWTAGVGPRFRGSPFDYFDPRTYWPNPLAPLGDLGRDAVFVSRDLMRRTGDLMATARPGNILSALQDQVLGYEWDILADIQPMERLIQENIDFAGIRQSQKELRITATSWQKGSTRTFDNSDFTDETGCRIITAAMAIPGAVPRQRVDLEEFVDGSMLMKHPLQPAIDAVDRAVSSRLTLHVIYFDPEFGEAPLMDVRGSFSVVYRLFLLAFSRSVNADIERIENVNRSLKFLDFLRAVDPESEVMKLWSRLHAEVRDAIEVEVHRYRAFKHVTSLRDLFIRVTPQRIASLIATGYDDACSHDCKESGCVLAGSG